MPFSQQFPRSFTTSSVHEFAPAMSGVYGISNSKEWFYIGATDDIRAALLQHLPELSAAFPSRPPTGFVFEVCDGASRSARQDRLVAEYEPVCNRRQSWRR